MEDTKCYGKWKNKFALVIDELKNFKVIETNSPKKIQPVNTSIYFINDDINSTIYYHLGFKNELASSLLVNEQNTKWYGFYKEPLLIVQDIEYIRRAQDFTHPEFVMFDIIDIYKDAYDRIFYIVSYPSRKHFYETIKNYKKLPLKNETIILNIKTDKCSCIKFKRYGRCNHRYIAENERRYIKLMFGLVLRRFINWSIAKQILFFSILW